MIPASWDHNVGTHNRDLGRRGEHAAEQWYVASGYRVLDRNWRCEQGELDLVVGHHDTVVFVEVKARSSSRYGTGFDAVGHTKQRRLRRLASAWLTERHRNRRDTGDPPGSFATDIRFDVVDVDARGNVRVREACF